MFEGVDIHESEINVEKVREQAFAKFCHTTVEGYRNFKARAEKNNGHIRIAVHPFFAERFPATSASLVPPDQFPDTLAHMREGFDRTVTSVTNRPDSAPLIVFEETRGIAATDDFITQTQGGQETAAVDDILVVETLNGTGHLNDETIAQLFNTLYPDTHPNYTEVLQNYTDLLNMKYLRSRERVLALAGEDWLRPYTDEERKALLRQIQEDMILDAPLEQYEKLLNSYRKTFFDDFIADAGIKSMLALGSYIDGKNNTTYLCLGMIVQSFRDVGIPVDISRYIVPGRESLKQSGVHTKETNR